MATWLASIKSELLKDGVSLVRSASKWSVLTEANSDVLHRASIAFFCAAARARYADCLSRLAPIAAMPTSPVAASVPPEVTPSVSAIAPTQIFPTCVPNFSILLMALSL